MAEPSAELPVVQGQEYRVKLGKSFTFPKENAFHTIKYDFKPLSVDHAKPGRLKVVGDEVNVSLPVVQAESVDDASQFRGPKKACAKECVLIINTETGEAVLEKISNTVHLKATRDGRKPRDRSVSPCPPYPSHMQSKALTGKSQLATPREGSGKPAANNRGQKRQAKSRAKTPKTGKRSTTPQQLSNAKQGTNRKTSKAVGDLIGVGGQMTQTNTSLSMPVFGNESGSMMQEISPIHSSNPTPEPIAAKKVKTDVTSSSDSSSSSSSSSSDSESEGEVPLSQTGHMTGHMMQPQAQPTINVNQSQMPQISQMLQMPQISHMAQPQMTQLQMTQPQMAQPQTPQLQMTQPQMMPGYTTQMYPAHTGQVIHQPSSSSGSSSDSDSDSSSGSSSSDSSDDSSDQKNDREVAAAFSQDPSKQQKSMFQLTELRNDLHLSDSGSDSDT